MVKKKGPVRYVVPFGDDPQEDARDALGVLDRCIAKDSAIRDVLLLVQGKGQLEAKSIGRALGAGVTKSLLKNQALRWSDSNASLRLATLRTFQPYSGDPDAVLVAYGNKKLLDLVDGMRDLRAVVVIGWGDLKQIDYWIKAWNAVVLGQEQSAEESPVENQVVEVALQSLSRFVNLGTGLANPDDRAAAEELFWILRDAGEWAEPEAVHSWALRNGWTPSGADDLKAAAEKVGKRSSRPRKPRRYWGGIEEFRKEVSR